MTVLLEGLFYILLVFIGFGLFGCVLWVAENTKLGEKLFGKLEKLDNCVENFFLSVLEYFS